jgi:hypothetical protein
VLVQAATYAHWLSLVGRRAPLDTGEVIDFSAPPCARSDRDRGTAKRHFVEDVQADLRSHTSLIPCAFPFPGVTPETL